MKQHFQILVIGSGFGGSLMAMISRQLGFATALIERGRHPRYVIGESSTPLANLLLEEVADEFGLPLVRPLSKWGTWQQHMPQLGCGIKRGFTFYHHTLGQPFETDRERRRQLMVGASPREAVADTHWYRPDFDLYLVQQAQALGVTYWDEVELTSAVEETDGMRLAGRRHGQECAFSADFVFDASGPRGFLHRTFGLSEQTLPGLPPTQSVFSQFRGVGELPPSFHAPGALPPYPPEQAAVHHIFAGGWIWVLKFNNGITSAGAAATDAVAEELEFKSGEAGWLRLLQRLPSLGEEFQFAKAVIPFVHQPRLAFRSGVIHGSRWALLPSAAGVVDPLLSTGFPLTLLGVVRLGKLLRSCGGTDLWELALEDYSRLTALELDATARLVGALYANMDRFDMFKPLSLLYFAAASFSEAARRLGKPHLADSFLLSRHPAFGKQLREICDAACAPGAKGETATLCRGLREAIAPFDVAGLTDTRRDPWYPAVPDDLLAGAGKLDASEAEVKGMLKICGLA
jgi:FADH2 O2-dependent halogenase